MKIIDNNNDYGKKNNIAIRITVKMIMKIAIT